MTKTTNADQSSLTTLFPTSSCPPDNFHHPDPRSGSLPWWNQGEFVPGNLAMCRVGDVDASWSCVSFGMAVSAKRFQVMGGLISEYQIGQTGGSLPSWSQVSQVVQFYRLGATAFTTIAGAIVDGLAHMVRDWASCASRPFAHTPYCSPGGTKEKAGTA
jgi:hypothetical protein